MDTKHVTTRAVLKADGADEGTLEAVFSTFNVVDHGNDIVLPSAIQDGKEIPMVWSHDWSRIIGKGVTHVETDRAVFRGRFFLDTTDGLDAYRTVKNMGSLQEYSWGFLVQDAAFEERDGKVVRVIKQAEQFEVSPVLAGEGMNTRTLALKHGQAFSDQEEAVLATVKDLVHRWQSLADLLLKEGRPISEARRSRMGTIADGLDSAAADLRAILKETEPAKGLNVDALLLDYLVTLARGNGVTV